MPLYDFECKRCNCEIELFKKMDEKPPNCPVCGRSMVRVMSGTSFILKGKGWFKSGGY